MLWLIYFAASIIPSPVNLVAKRIPSLSGISKTAFELHWKNVVEDSIVKAFYKIGVAPTKNYDTTGSLSGSPPDTIYISQKGKCLLFVWFMDTKGNIDYRNNAAITLISPFSFHLFNETINRRFTGGISFGIGKVFDTGFSSSNNLLNHSVVEEFHCKWGFQKSFSSLVFHFIIGGTSPDILNKEPVISKNFYLTQVKITGSYKFEIIHQTLGAKSFIGWHYLKKEGYLKIKDKVTNEEKVEIDDKVVDNGLTFGINMIKYVIPNITFSDVKFWGLNIVGIAAEYQYSFCMDGIHVFGGRIINAIITSKDIFCTTSLKLKKYQGSSLKMLCFGLDITAYFKRVF